MRSARGILFVLAFLVLPSGAVQAADLVRLSGGVGNLWSWTESLDALQESDRLLVGEIRAGVGVWDSLSVELGYRRLTGEGEAFPSLRTSTSLHAVDLGARYDWFLLSWLSTYARAGASFAWGELSLTQDELRLVPEALTGGLYGAAGLSARLPRAWFGGEDDAKGGRGFTIGFQLDVGYGWFAPLSLSARARVPGEALGQQRSVALGDLSLHGLSYQFALVLHL